MFSSTNNLHLFPLQQYFPSSSSSPSYHHHHLVAPLPSPPPHHHHPEPVYIGPPQDPVLSGVVAPIFLQVQEEDRDQARMKNEQQEVAVLMSQNGNNNNNSNGQCFSSSTTLNNFTKKGSVKKDRHSKIYTAQGLRDRRVRLSIDISRKFFDLQDMLGYDKASKTLDWLLTKSRKAIKELTKKTQYHNNNNNIITSSSSSSKFHFDHDFEECEVISNDDDDEEAEKIIMLGKSSSNCKKNLGFHDVLAKESRAKARARARERTKEKMIMNQQFRSPPPPPPQPSMPTPVVQKVAGSDQENNNIIGIMWKPSPMVTSSSSYQKNLVISKGESCNYNNYCNNFYFPASNLTPNWDINIDSTFARTQSGFCSIANMDSLPGNFFIFTKCMKKIENKF